MGWSVVNNRKSKRTKIPYGMYVCMYVYCCCCCCCCCYYCYCVVLLGGSSSRCGVRGYGVRIVLIGRFRKSNGMYVCMWKASKKKEKKRKRNNKKGRIRVCGRGKYREITRTVFTYRSLCPRPIDIVVPI